MNEGFIKEQKLEFVSHQIIKIPRDSQILSVKVHDNDPFLWYITSEPNDVRMFDLDIYMFEKNSSLKPYNLISLGSIIR